MKQITALNIQYPKIFQYEEFLYVYNYYLNHKNEFKLDLKPLSFYSIRFKNQQNYGIEYFFIGAFKRLIEYNINDISYCYVFLKILPACYSHVPLNKTTLSIEIFYFFEEQLAEYVVVPYNKSEYLECLNIDSFYIKIYPYTFDNIRLAMKKFS